MTKNLELNEVQSLLNDFPPKKPITPKDALKEINVRYNVLSNLIQIKLTHFLTKPETQISNIFINLPNRIHKFLCNGIFSNAGVYRNINDPHSGDVFFGPSKHRGIRIEKFKGCPPGDIHREISQICSILSKKDTQVVKTAATFYQQFVYIHPFYDLNGRIGRLLTKMYLEYHGLYLPWKMIETNNELKDQFINRLNRCHDQMNKPSYEYKINSLCKFWNKFIIPTNELLKEN